MASFFLDKEANWPTGLMEVDPLVYVTVETHVVEGDSHVSEPTRSAVGPTGLIRRSESEARESESRNGVGGWQSGNLKGQLILCPPYIFAGPSTWFAWSPLAFQFSVSTAELRWAIPTSQGVAVRVCVGSQSSFGCNNVIYYLVLIIFKFNFLSLFTVYFYFFTYFLLDFFIPLKLLHMI